MKSSCLGKLVLKLFITGCAILCYSVCTRASLTYIDDTVIFFELNEGENMTIDCTTNEPAYHTALSFHREPIPLFYLAPNGKKLIKIGQAFTVTNLTEQDAGDYGCIAKDKNLQNSTISKAELVIILPPKPKPLEDNAVQKNKTVVETASMKLSGSKPYVYFKVKSPVHISMTAKKPFNLSVSVKGLQPIKIHWHKDLYQLVIGSRYKTFDDSRRLLVEPPFTEEDSGIYSAAACNTKGCEVRGVQVMFYTMLNRTFMKQGQDDEQGEGEGFIGNWITENGILGVPLGLAIILIIAIVGMTRSKKKRKATIMGDLMYELQDIEMQKHRGEGRTDSLWSWHSEGDTSPDEMPDYDKMKYKKQSRRHPPKDTEREEYFDKDGYEGEYEGTEHYGQQQYYSGEETFHDTPDHGENRFLQETDSKDGVDYNTGADDETIYGSQERYDHDEHHGVTTRSKDSHVEEEPQESMLSSFFGYMKHQAKRIEDFVSPAEQPPPTEDTDSQVVPEILVEDTEVTQGTVAEDTEVTQDTVAKATIATQGAVAKDTKVTQDTVVEDSELMVIKDFKITKDTATVSKATIVKQGAVAKHTKVTEDTVAKETKVTEDTVAKETKVTQDTVAKETKVTQDTVAKETKVTQDTVAKETKVTQDTVAKETKVTQDADASIIEEEEPQQGFFSSIFGFMKRQAKRIEIFASPTAPAPAPPTTEDTDTQVTQDTVAKDTKVTQGTVAKDTKGTQGTVAKDTKGTQGTVAKDTKGAQGTVAKDTKVTQGTLAKDTKGTQGRDDDETDLTHEAIASEIQAYGFFDTPDIAEFD